MRLLKHHEINFEFEKEKNKFLSTNDNNAG